MKIELVVLVFLFGVVVGYLAHEFILLENREQKLYNAPACANWCLNRTEYDMNLCYHNCHLLEEWEG